jgi:mono/diheme cytochrome c family protein
MVSAIQIFRRVIPGVNARALLLCLTLSIGSAAAAQKTGPVSFNKDIRPILSDHCFNCHGPDEKTRKAKLRLDLREAAVRQPRSGQAAIVPGKPEESELLRRVVSEDEEERMPPPKLGKVLSREQIALLKKWIEEGAEYEPHWAFVPPVRPSLPAIKNRGWPRNEIDHFILSRLEQEGFKPHGSGESRLT